MSENDSGPVTVATKAYLRVCASGGMPKDLRDQVERSVAEAERLGYYEQPPETAVLEACMAKMTTALCEAARQFDFYAGQHAAKGTPDADAKAQVNREMAQKMREALLTQAPMTNAMRDVASERRRQVKVEGRTAEHDDQNDRGEMAMAAAAYAYSSVFCEEDRQAGLRAPFWPAKWSLLWYKMTSPRRDLVKAGALILAEIERLDRAAGRKA